MKPYDSIQEHSQRPTILLIDDNPANLGIITEYLEAHSIRVLVARNGKSGVKKAQYAAPALILLDVLMPETDGFTICQQLKADEGTRDIPVIFMTALTDPKDKVRGFEVGGVDYVTKPIQPEEVFARVSTHLRIHQLTQRLQDRNTKLEELNQALTGSLETLQLAQEELLQAEKMAALGHLVAGIAHEVNTPIGIGVTAASYLEEKTREIEEQYDENLMKRSDLEKYFKTARESTSMILKNLQRAAEQIQGFKQVAVDRASSEARRFTLKAYIDDLLTSLHPKLKQTSHTISINCPEELEVISYPGAFSQIITNLLFNSLDHGFEDEKHGEIILDVSGQNDILRLQYSDNGKGMTQEERSQVFEPFYTTKRGQGGSGLGLYIVYNVVTQRLNGTIECKSSPGSGTAFIIQLPVKTFSIPSEAEVLTYNKNCNGTSKK